MQEKFTEDNLILHVQKTLTPGNVEWIDLKRDFEFADSSTCMAVREQLR